MACSEHRCLKLCGKNCGECTYMIKKVLPCGHSANLACSKDPIKHFCTVKVPSTLKCGHISDKECSSRNKPTCTHLCTGFLSCGHPCKNLCHGGIGRSFHSNMVSTNFVESLTKENLNS